MLMPGCLCLFPRPRRIGLRIAVAVGLALAIIPAAASSASVPQKPRPLLVQPAPPRHPEPLPPIASLTIAAGITTEGDPVGATADFAATVPDVLAVVDVGYLGSLRHQRLTITWSSAPPNSTAHTLFSQHLRVVSGDVAYAAALNPGRMRLGLYRIDVALASAHQSAWFVVYDPDGALGGPASGPTAGPAETAAVTARYVEDDASSEMPPATGTAAVPTGGPAGTVGPPSSPTGGAGCQLDMNGDASGTVLVDWTGCSGDDVGISATVNGQTQLVQTAHAADASVPVRVDPCSIDPGIGYGNTSVAYTATVLAGPDKGKSATVSGTQSTPAPTLPPSLVPVDYSPDLGSQVSAGQHILLSLEAHSDSGIRSVTVTADPGGTLADKTYSKQPSRCTTTGRDQIVVARPYTVPADPPALITITAVATDFAGQTQTFVGTYPTEAVWAGTVTGYGKAIQMDPGNTGTCSAYWVMWLQVGVSKTKQISGTAQVSTNSIPCVYTIGPEDSFPGGVSTFKVTGSYDGKTFRLMLPQQQTNSAYYVGVLCLLNSDDVDCTSNAPRTFLFTLTGDRSAKGHLDVSLSAPAGEGTRVTDLNLEGNLACCYSEVGPAAQATKTPPIYLP
jgi:hypothetical protein